MSTVGLSDRVDAAIAEMKQRHGIDEGEIIGEALGLLLVVDRWLEQESPSASEFFIARLDESGRRKIGIRMREPKYAPLQ